MNCIKGQKDMIPKDESPRSEGIQYAIGEEWKRITNSPRMNEGNNAQLWICLVRKVKSDAAKNSTIQELECQVHESRKIGYGQAGDGKNKHQHPRNQ